MNIARVETRAIITEELMKQANSGVFNNYYQNLTDTEKHRDDQPLTLAEKLVFRAIRYQQGEEKDNVSSTKVADIVILQIAGLFEYRQVSNVEPSNVVLGGLGLMHDTELNRQPLNYQRINMIADTVTCVVKSMQTSMPEATSKLY